MLVTCSANGIIININQLFEIFIFARNFIARSCESAMLNVPVSILTILIAYGKFLVPFLVPPPSYYGSPNLVTQLPMRYLCFLPVHLFHQLALCTEMAGDI